LRHVLIVDDEPYVCNMVQLALEARVDYRVSRALSGPAALQKLDQDRPDLAILDIVLPGMSGIDLARAASARGIPLIMATGYSDTATDFQQLGWPMLRKPFAMKELFERVERTLGEAELNLRQVRALMAEHTATREALEQTRAGLRDAVTKVQAKLREPAPTKPEPAGRESTVRAAYHMLENYGRRAARVAEQRAASAGSKEGAATWQNIAHALRRIDGRQE
jgi:DNA-binding response OmpR family regulator